METAMPAIGHVTKQKDGSFKGQIKTPSIRAPIDILPNTAKNSDTQPDFRVYSQTVEIGGGWWRVGKSSGEKYLSLSLADPVFGPKKLYCNLGTPAGQDDENVFALIWNTLD